MLLAIAKSMIMWICRSQFGNLGKMIGMHQRLKENSRFLFIPGPDDAGILENAITKILLFSFFWLKFTYIELYTWEHSLFFWLKISGPSKVLPRCALPKYLTEELQEHIPNAIFSSNPCRLRFVSFSCLTINKNFNWISSLIQTTSFYILNRSSLSFWHSVK